MPLCIIFIVAFIIAIATVIHIFALYFYSKHFLKLIIFVDNDDDDDDDDDDDE